MIKVIRQLLCSFARLDAFERCRRDVRPAIRVRTRFRLVYGRSKRRLRTIRLIPNQANRRKL